MGEPQKIVIQDGDAHGAVLGIITLVENTVEDFEDMFTVYKEKHPDSWWWEGFMDFLIDHDWKFDWESGNVHALEI